jgi:hypothetical protein
MRYPSKGTAQSFEPPTIKVGMLGTKMASKSILRALDNHQFNEHVESWWLIVTHKSIYSKQRDMIRGIARPHCVGDPLGLHDIQDRLLLARCASLLRKMGPMSILRRNSRSEPKEMHLVYHAAREGPTQWGRAIPLIMSSCFA